MVIRLSGGILTYLVESFSGAHIFANYKYRSGGRPIKAHHIKFYFLSFQTARVVSYLVLTASVCFCLLCCCAVCDCSSAFLLNLYLTFTLLFKVIIYNLIPTIFLVLSIKLI